MAFQIKSIRSPES